MQSHSQLKESLIEGEELHYSLDKLDEVISTFDEESAHHIISHYNITKSNNKNKYLAIQSSAVTLSGSFNNTDSTMSTFGKSQRHSYEVSALTKLNVVTGPDDIELIPPPPDSFRSEYFSLPPPPLPHPESSLLVKNSCTSRTDQSVYRNTFSIYPQNTAQPYQVTRLKVKQEPQTNQPSSIFRPSIPQRDPSTRLTSIAHHQGHFVKDVPQHVHTNDGFYQETVIKPSKPQTTAQATKLSDSLTSGTIEQTTVPVADIIQRFGKLAQDSRISSDCTSAYSKVNSANVNKCKQFDQRKSKQPSTVQQSHLAGDLDKPCLNKFTLLDTAATNTLTAPQTRQGTTTCHYQRLSSESATYCNLDGLIDQCSSLVSNPDSSQLCNGVSTFRQSPILRPFDSGSNSVNFSLYSLPVYDKFTPHSDLPSPNSDFVTISSAVSQNNVPSIERCPPNEITVDPLARKPDSHFIKQLNGTLAQQRAANEAFVDELMSMNLDDNTLAILNQFNIVSISQIPGCHTISTKLPDWKINILRNKNRDIINNYADELRKWGGVPDWKRKLIEKRQSLHNNSPTSKPPSMYDHSIVMDKPLSSNTNTFVSSELAEKLQRQLEKVSAASAGP